MQPAGDHRFFAELPLTPQGTVLYRVTVKFQDGSTFTLADNRADPYYQLYQGHTVKLYCTNFETNPFMRRLEGRHRRWRRRRGNGARRRAARPIRTWRSPASHILAQALDGDYAPMSHSWVETPEIDVGRYSDVRLQYRRWLGVEDSHFDQAQILANGTRAWMNFTDNMGDNSATAHLDKEWRFHDVPLSGYFSGHKLTVRWDLASDPGLEFGGWQLDDVCIVANPNAICGDSIKTSSEQCDNGPMNADLPDACRTYCRLPTCGDQITDSNEECDDGSAGSPECSNKCTTISLDNAGCCSTGGGQGSVALSLLLGTLLLRRRRA